MKAVTPFTPVKIYEGIVENNDEAKKEYHQILEKLREVDILISEYEIHDIDDPDSAMETDFFANKEEEEFNAKMDLWLPFCNKYLKPLVDKIVEEEECGNLWPDDIWTQVTEGFQMHHPHNHGDDGYSFVWYIDVDPSVHKGTVYYDPVISKDNQYETEIAIGKVCIWPSYLLHYQPPSNSDIKRYIISGNLKSNSSLYG